MNSSTLWGILLGASAIFGAFMLEGGSSSSLFILPALIIVIIGTFAATLAGSSFNQFSKIPRLIKLSFSKQEHDIEKVINQITALSNVARKDGVLSLEQYLSQIDNLFLKKLIRLSIDGATPEIVHHVADTELDHITHRHNENISLFTKMGGYSPTMGIIGTVMGLIATLAAAGSDPNQLIRHIATAFIATLWGIFMANIVWFPIADRLKTMHVQELQSCKVIYDGVFGLVSGETPSVVRSRMLSFYSLSRQEKILMKK